MTPSDEELPPERDVYHEHIDDSNDEALVRLEEPAPEVRTDEELAKWLRDFADMNVSHPKNHAVFIEAARRLSTPSSEEMGERIDGWIVGISMDQKTETFLEIEFNQEPPPRQEVWEKASIFRWDWSATPSPRDESGERIEGWVYPNHDGLTGYKGASDFPFSRCRMDSRQVRATITLHPKELSDEA